MVEQQLQRGKLNSGKVLDYAFGLEHGKYRGLETVDHGGADAGYRADLLRFPEQHFSVACLCNKGEIGPGRLTRKVADIYLAKEFKEPLKDSKPADKPTAVSEQTLSQYTGLYWRKDENQAVRIVSKEGKLFLAQSSDDRLELTALGEKRFELAVAPVIVTFEKGTPQRMLVQEQGAEKADIFERVSEFKPGADQLAAFAGEYVSGEIDPVYRITVENGGLVLKRLKWKPEKLEATIADHFTGLNGDLHFEKDAAGKVTGFVLNEGRVRNFRFRKDGAH
jgi:hypothetical protein